MKSRVAAVIPNWNGAGRLERCLASLESQERPFDRVVVVDNGSTDGSENLAQVRLTENHGFAVAVNRGIRECGEADWIAILNNDVVLNPAWLAALLDAPEEFLMRTGRTLQMPRPLDRSLTVAAHHAARNVSREVNRDVLRAATVRERSGGLVHLLDGAGDALSLGLAATRLGHGQPDDQRYAEGREVFGVCFAAALIHGSVFRAAGLLEERFFAYLEDAEFCLRARLLGFSAWYEPEAVASHEGSATSGGELAPKVVEWMTAHQLLLAARYASPEMWGPVTTVQVLWAVRMLRYGRIGAWLRGVRTAQRLWDSMRDAMPVDRDAVARILHQSEKSIRADGCAHDLFWRFYFGLT